jgi:hypothetical protein
MIPIPLTTDEMETYAVTTDEMETYADRAAKLMSDLDDAEEEYKLIQRDWRNKLKEIRLDMRRHLKAYGDKAENREVECEQCFNVDTSETWYEYNGKEYDRKTLEPYEAAQLKQGVLFGDGANMPQDGEDESDDDDEGLHVPPMEDPPSLAL